MLASEFLKKYDVTGDIKYGDDFTEDSEYGAIPRRRWMATLTHMGRVFATPYYTGVRESDPQLSDVLYSIGSDARYGAMDLDEFLGEFGAENVEEQRKTWRACKEASRALYDWVSSEAMWDDLLMVDEG